MSQIVNSVTDRSGPQVPQAERDRIERLDADRIVVLRAGNQEPLPVVEPKRLEGAVRRVDEPQVGNSFARIDRALRARSLKIY